MVETYYFNGLIGKCFENSTLVDDHSPPSTIISLVRTNGNVFKVFTL